MNACIGWFQNLLTINLSVGHGTCWCINTRSTVLDQTASKREESCNSGQKHMQNWQKESKCYSMVLKQCVRLQRANTCMVPYISLPLLQPYVVPQCIYTCIIPAQLHVHLYQDKRTVPICFQYTYDCSVSKAGFTSHIVSTAWGPLLGNLCGKQSHSLHALALQHFFLIFLKLFCLC